MRGRRRRHSLAHTHTQVTVRAFHTQIDSLPLQNRFFSSFHLMTIIDISTLAHTNTMCIESAVVFVVSAIGHTYTVTGARGRAKKRGRKTQQPDEEARGTVKTVQLKNWSLSSDKFSCIQFIKSIGKREEKKNEQFFSPSFSTSLFNCQ